MAAGLSADLPLEDAIGVAGILVQTGRTVPANRWVENWIEAEQQSALDNLM